MVAGQTTDSYNNEEMYCGQYDYYSDFYPQQQDICPQQGHQPQVCTVHGDYGEFVIIIKRKIISIFHFLGSFKVTCICSKEKQKKKKNYTEFPYFFFV